MENSTFTIVLPTAKLKTLFQERIRVHSARADELAAKAEELAKAARSGTGKEIAVLLTDAIVEEATSGPYGSMMHDLGQATQVVKGLERKIAGHRAAVDMFNFYHDHLDPSQTVVRLTREDCLVLELTKGFYAPDGIINAANGNFLFSK